MWRSSAFIDCVVLREEDAVHFLGAPDWVSLEVSIFEIEQGASPFLLEDFGRV